MRSPSAQRKVAIDQHRVDDLQRIAFGVDAYYASHGNLPPDIVTVADGQVAPHPRDPVTAAPYDYEARGAGRYRLCAVFDTDSAKTGEIPITSGLEAWGHHAGHYCFERVAPKRGTQAG
jgi:hypothetical protein